MVHTFILNPMVLSVCVFVQNCDCASCVSFFAQRREQAAQVRRFHELAEMRRKAVSAFEEYYEVSVSAS